MNQQTTNEIIEACKILAFQKNLKVTVGQSLQASVFAGVSTLVFVLLGRPGILGGAALGSALALALAMNYKSVVDVINEMNASDQAQLVNNITNALQNVDIRDIGGLILIEGPVQSTAVAAIGNFLSQRGYQLV